MTSSRREVASVRGGALTSVPVAPGRLPLIGHALALARDPLRFLESLRSAGDIVRVDLGAWPVYALTTSELVRQALTVNGGSLVRGRIYDRARSVFGDGLATSDGELHRTRRRLAQPAFHQRRIAAYADTMSNHARDLAGSWQAGQRVAVDEAMHDLTLRTVVAVLFSTDLGRSVAGEIQRLMPVIMRGITARMVTPRRLDGWPIPVNRRFDASAARLRQVIREMIVAHDAAGRSGDNLLSLFLAERDKPDGTATTDEHVSDEVVSILMAGAETPATTLAWTFHELARHPEVERRMHAEIDAVIGSRPVGFDDVARLTYTGQVLTEVLRLHSVLLFTRRAIAETEIGGVTIPPGTEIAFSPYAMHRDPNRYPEPARFDPDRWAREPAPSGPTNAFNPFSSGQHKCIGDSFAMTEMSIALATIAQRWRLRPADGQPVRTVVAAVPRPHSLRMVAEPRRSRNSHEGLH